MWNPYEQKGTGPWSDVFSKIAPDVIKTVPNVISSIGSLIKPKTTEKKDSERNKAIKEELKNPNLTAKERADLIKLLT